MANPENPKTPTNLPEFSDAQPPSPEKALSSGYPDLATASKSGPRPAQFDAPRATPKPSTYTGWGPDCLTYGWGPEA